MKERKRRLPSGWYPDTAAGVAATIDDWERSLGPCEKRSAAAIAPHAGWGFSGELAYDVIRRIEADADTVAVIGGHLPESDLVLAAGEQSFETPLGSMQLDEEISSELGRRLSFNRDEQADNTVEVQLPILKSLFPRSRILYLRVAPTSVAARLGEVLADVGKRLGRRIAVVASTDLTHYGPNYGFAPKGQGVAAVDWVRDTNDRRFIERALSMDMQGVLEVANTENSACSAGAAVAAIAFALQTGASESSLVGHRLSYDIQPSSSFVGYAGITYRRPD